MSKIIDFARLQVGKPYVFAASGPDKWDCSGLTKRAAAQVGLVWYHGASKQYHRGYTAGTPDTWYGYWDAYGTIDTIPPDRVCFLFNEDKKKPGVMAHTGLYDPVTGNVIQAGGQYRGVSEHPINRKRWTYWATLRKPYDEMGGDKMAEMITGTSVVDDELYPVLQNGRKDFGSVGPVHDLQKLLNIAGADPALKVDGIFGNKTELAVTAFQKRNGLTVDGIAGKSTWQALAAHEPPAAPVNVVEQDEMVQIPLSALKDLIDAVDVMKTYMPK